ncbi:MAG: hypothetical protein ABFD91_18975 [Anaerohalosphaeraceae bacterium]
MSNYIKTDSIVKTLAAILLTVAGWAFHNAEKRLDDMSGKIDGLTVKVASVETLLKARGDSTGKPSGLSAGPMVSAVYGPSKASKIDGKTGGLE